MSYNYDNFKEVIGQKDDKYYLYPCPDTLYNTFEQAVEQFRLKVGQKVFSRFLPKYKYHLIDIVDSFKSNWYLWHCEREDEEGNLVEGDIQADYIGEGIAEETFEPYE